MIKRTFIVLIIATVVLTAVYVGISTYTAAPNDNSAASDTNSTQPSTNGGTDANIDVAPTKGDIAINKSTEYRSMVFDVETARVASAYRNEQAPDGKQFIVLYLKPLREAPKEDPAEWAGSDIRLTGQSGLDEQAYEMSLPGSAGQQGGYLVFRIPTDQKTFTLTFGSGSNAPKIDIVI